MFRISSFRSDRAYWPLPERSDFDTGTHGFAAWFAKLLALPRHLKASLAARRAMQALADLDDRTLRDIGIERAQIWHAARYGRGALQDEQVRLDAARW